MNKLKLSVLIACLELFPKPNDTMPCWETFIDTVQPSIAAHVKKMLEIKQLLLGNLTELRELAKPNINSKKDFEDASNAIEYTVFTLIEWQPFYFSIPSKRCHSIGGAIQMEGAILFFRE